MKRFVIDTNLDAEHIESYRNYFEGWSDYEINAIVDCDITTIWRKLVEKELFYDSMQTFLLLSEYPFKKYLCEDEISDLEKILESEHKVREKLGHVNPGMYAQRYVITDVEEESNLNIRLHKSEEQGGMQPERGCLRNKKIPIDTLRLLSSENFLLDILLGISFTIQYCTHDDKYIPLYKEGDSVADAVWKSFINKGKSKYDKLPDIKKDKFMEFLATEEYGYYSEEGNTIGFIEKTKQMTPISGKIKDIHKHVPEIQDIVPNIFKGFIQYPDFRDCYKASRKQNNYIEEKIFEVECIIPQEKFHEQYIFEEITGKKLGKHVYALLSTVFKLVNYDVFNTGVRENLEEFIYTLLKCRGVYTRIFLVDSLNLMRNDQFLHSISDTLSHRERIEKYVSGVLERYIKEADNLREYGKELFDKLSKELFYILWCKSEKEEKELLDIKKICDDYVSGKLKRKQSVQEVGNISLYSLVQKTVMQGVMQEKLLI